MENGDPRMPVLTSFETSCRWIPCGKPADPDISVTPRNSGFGISHVFYMGWKSYSLSSFTMFEPIPAWHAQSKCVWPMDELCIIISVISWMTAWYSRALKIMLITFSLGNETIFSRKEVIMGRKHGEKGIFSRCKIIL